MVRERLNGEEDPRILWIKNATYHDEGLSLIINYYFKIQYKSIDVFLNYIFLGDYYCEGFNHNVLINKDFIVRSAKFTVNIIGKPAVIEVCFFQNLLLS